ncbi:MAG: hypothetical protein PHG08_00750 [Bacilli bacterium]|nr:hypothetical protein [Bacilli bacterium]
MDKNFILLAAKYYDSVDFSAFQKELERGLIIKKSIKKYYKTGYLNIRLTLNHVIILYNYFNVFGTNILFQVIPPEHWSLLVTILKFLDRLPDKIPNTQIKTSTIKINEKIEQELLKI